MPTETLPKPVTPITPETKSPAFAANASDLRDVSLVKEVPPSDPLAEFRSFIGQYQPDTTALDSQRADLQTSRNELLRGANRVERAEAVDQQFGVTDAIDGLGELDEQIAELQGTFDRAIVDEEGRAIAGRFITGRQAQIAKQAAVQVGALQAIRSAKANKLALAQQQANRALQLEFADREDELQALNQEIEDNAAEIERRTGKSKEELQLALGERTRLLEEEKSNRSQVLAIAQEAAANGASNAELSRITAAQTPEAALAVGGRYIGLLNRQNIRDQIANRNAATALALKKFESEMQSVNGTGTLNGEPQNTTQALVNSYANRMVEAERTFQLFDGEFAGNLDFGGSLPNVLQSDERQQFEQAKRNFVNAVLRRESGAVISAEEFAEADKQYFAQAGDSDTTLQQKAENRNTVINNFYREANVPRPVFAGDIIESDGKKYRVEPDGVTITPI